MISSEATPSTITHDITHRENQWVFDFSTLAAKSQFARAVEDIVLTERPVQHIQDTQLLYNFWVKLAFDNCLNLPKTWAVEQDIALILDDISSKKTIITDYQDVLDYLLRYQDMLDVLPDICDKAMEKLGSAAQRTLNVFHDSETEAEYLELIIRTKLYDQNVMDTIDELQLMYDEEFNSKNGWLVFTTDFLIIQ